MPGKVTDYESNYDEAVAPKTLHGVKEVRMLVIQCANNDGRTQVLLGIEIEPGDIRTFPEKSWESLGKPSSWLKEQLDAELYGKKPAVEKTSEKPVAKKGPVNVKMDGAV